jgi:hypothetical protein
MYVVFGEEKTRCGMCTRVEIVGNGRNGIVGPFEAQCRVGSIENRL